MKTRELAGALIADKTWKPPSFLAALRKPPGGAVVGECVPTQWKLLQERAWLHDTVLGPEKDDIRGFISVILELLWMSEMSHAYTDQRQIRENTVFAIIRQWPGVRRTKLPSSEHLSIEFYGGEVANVEVIESNRDFAIIKAPDGANWRMDSIGAKGSPFPPTSIPDRETADHWIVKGLVK